MSSEFEEALMGLDLGAAPPETFNENVMFSIEDVQKTQIHRLKKRIIATNTLIQLHDDKKKLLITTENMLSNLKTEYKLARDESQATCKNYKMIQDKCTKLEAELGQFKSKCRELECLLQDIESKEAAAQIFTNQLQQLVKERDSKIEALKLENNLIKGGTIGFRKRITKQSSIIAALTNNLSNVADVVFTNRTLNKREKMSLYKYMRIQRMMKEKEHKNTIFESLEDEIVNDDNDDDVLSELEDTADDMVFQTPSSTIEETDKGNDSDNSVSEDTGRGASPVSSDKGFFSPEYCFDGPPSVGSIKTIHKESDCQVTTTLQSPNPKKIKETRDFATSPIAFEGPKHNTLPTVKDTPKVMINQATSPLKADACTSIDIPEITYTDITFDEILPLPPIRGKEKNDGQQPLLNTGEKVTLDGIKRLPNTGDRTTIDGIEPLSPVASKCSDKYGNLCDEHGNDEEIEMILANMRVHRDLVTPIPTTPARSISTSTVLSKTSYNLSFLSKMFETPEFVNAVKKVFDAAISASKSVEEVSEKDDNTPANDNKQLNEKTDSDMELDDCDDPIILDHSFNKGKCEEKHSPAKPKSKASQKLLFEDDPDDKAENAVKVDKKKMLKDKKSAAIEKIKDKALSNNTEVDDMQLARELRSRKIGSPVTTKKRENARETVNNNKVTKKAKKRRARIIYDDSDDESNEGVDGNSSANSDVITSEQTIKETNENSKLCVEGHNKKVDERDNAKNKVGEVKSQKEVTRRSRLSTETNNSELITIADLLSPEKDQSVCQITTKKHEKTVARNSMELHDHDFDDCDSLEDDPIILHHPSDEEPILSTSKTLLFEEDPPSQDKVVAEVSSGDKGAAEPLQDKAKNAKAKKLSKLEKMRKKFQPKSKIKSVDSPRKLRTRVLSAIKNQKTETNPATSNNKEENEKAVKVTSKEVSSATLNDKAAYQKAAEVAAAERAKLMARQNTTKGGCGIVKRKQNSVAISSSNEQSSNKSECSNGRNKSASKENPLNDHDKKDTKSLVNSQKGFENRNIRLSINDSELITVVDVASLKKKQKGRRYSYQEEKVCKIIPRMLRSNSDSQRRNSEEVRDSICTRSTRKSLSSEFDSVKVINRSKYPSFSLDKDPVIVINQSNMGKNIKEMENNDNKTPKEIEARKSLEAIVNDRRKSVTPPKDKVELDKCDAKEMRRKSLTSPKDKVELEKSDAKETRRKSLTPPKDKVELDKCDARETRRKSLTTPKDKVELEKCNARETCRKSVTPPTDKVELDKCDAKETRLKSVTPPKDKVELEKCDSKELRKRPYEGKSSQPKRVLRSSLRSDQDNDVNKETRANNRKSRENELNVSSQSPRADRQPITNSQPSIINYSDLDLFADEPDAKKQRLRKDSAKNNEITVMPTINEDTENPKDSLLIQIIEKHGVHRVKYHPPKPSEEVDSVQEKIQNWVTQVTECHTKGENVTQEMEKFVDAMKKLKFKDFMGGLMKFLGDPQRKIELFNKVYAPPAPSMTKSEQVLLYVIPKLRKAWQNKDTVEEVFNHIEYSLFKLNGTPEFDAVESMSHFYASLCMYVNERNRLRLFMLNAMYCINFKAIPLIKQCLEVWLHALPLAHTMAAKSPLVTCVVYLLHYYKTKEDMFNRVQDIRDILSRKYFYRITEWNETKILNMFRNAILELKDSQIERKMLRLALLILAKRQGARWCQNKLISNLLQPLIDQAESSDRTKAFCVSLLGSLAKPFPMDMKVHCEIIMNKLLDLLQKNPSPVIQEAVIKSLIIMNRHNLNRVAAAIFNWHPTKVSPELENLLKDFVRERPVKYWKKLLQNI